MFQFKGSHWIVRQPVRWPDEFKKQIISSACGILFHKHLTCNYIHKVWISISQYIEKLMTPKLKGLIFQAHYTLSVKLSDFTVWRHNWRKNWVNYAVSTGNSAGLRTVLSSRLSQRELRSSFRESHSFLSLPADTTMASCQGTQPSKTDKRKATLPFKYHFLLHILSFLFFSDNIMADVGRKQQTTT